MYPLQAIQFENTRSFYITRRITELIPEVLLLTFYSFIVRQYINYYQKIKVVLATTKQITSY